MKKPKLELCVIDAMTGAVISPENLFAVLATEKRLDWVGTREEEAVKLAHNKGTQIQCELLHAVAAEELSAEDVYSVAEVFGFHVEIDNDGQLVIYTDVKAK